MPNPVLTKALDALMSRKDLGTDQTAAVLAEIMAGNASEVETAGVLQAFGGVRQAGRAALRPGHAPEDVRPAVHVPPPPVRVRLRPVIPT